MQEKVWKGLKVEIDFAHPPLSVVGTIVHIDPHTLVVSLAPEEEREQLTAPLTEHGEVRVSATAEDALYRFTSTLRRSSGLLLYLSPPGRVQRVQRRGQVRQPCLLDVEFVAPTGGGAPAQPKRATVVNISCGGLLMVYVGDLELGDPVKVSMKFPQGEPPLQADGTVVRTERFSRFGRDLCRVALRLGSLTRDDEKRLFQFITKLQVKATLGRAHGGVRGLRTPKGRRGEDARDWRGASWRGSV